MHRPLPRWTLPLGFGLLLATAVVSAGPRQDPEFKVHAVAGTVSYIEGSGGGNIGVSSGADGLFVVDDHLAQYGAKVVQALASVSDEPVRFLLNTHWHGDHTGNNATVAAGAPILAHANVRRRLAGDPAIGGRTGVDTPAAALPVLTYEEGITLHLNGEEIVVLHFERAHTDGDSVVLFTGSNVLHMGDLFFNGRFPYIDLDSGGSVQGYVDAVAGILASLEGDVRIIPGHGPLATTEDLRGFHAMLLETTERVRKALAAGKTAADMKAEGLLDDYKEKWAWGFIDENRFLDILTTGLGE